MSFINWGGESPEQRAARARIEQEAIYEQASRIARARAGQSPGAGSGDAGGNNNSSTVYYLRALNSNDSPNSEPWGRTTNIDEMNAVFGENGWALGFIDSLNVSSVFNETTTYVFIEGSDYGAEEFANFLTENIGFIQEWVHNGGNLFLNAAPNEGGDINFLGFNVTLLNEYFAEIATIQSGAESHPIFVGPGNTGTDWTGDNFAHAALSGEFTTLIINPVSGPGHRVVCAESQYGLGKVIFGTMTVTEFHGPQPEATYLRQNIHAYLGGVSYVPQLGITRIPQAVSISSRPAESIKPEQNEAL